MQITQWVYVFESVEGWLTIGLTSYVDKCLTDAREKNEQILYLCPFNTPFDAVAHKHLLDDISQESVKNYIRAQKERTQVWVSIVNDAMNRTAVI
jgi:hypothetical protein